MYKKLLIVGGTGFIGLHVAKEALDRGFLVTIIAFQEKFESEKINGIEYLCLDIRNKVELKKYISNRVFHYVINLSGYIEHSNYFDIGNEAIDVHFSGTKNIVDSINRQHLRTFIQIGSSDEYGRNAAPQIETQRELPATPYSFAKTAITNFLEMLYVSEKFPVVILRLFLVYGPGQKIDRFIPQIIKGCMDDVVFSVSKGEQIRDFCFVSDIVDGILSSIDNNDALGEVINLASGVPVSIQKVINIVKSLVGFGSPDFGCIPYRVGENMVLYADTNKAQKLLGWKASTLISDGLNDTVNYYNREFL
jgi:nucleoside-diphosphate-sugar epimerase